MIVVQPHDPFIEIEGARYEVSARLAKLCQALFEYADKRPLTTDSLAIRSGVSRSSVPIYLSHLRAILEPHGYRILLENNGYRVRSWDAIEAQVLEPVAIPKPLQ